MLSFSTLSGQWQWQCEPAQMNSIAFLMCICISGVNVPSGKIGEDLFFNWSLEVGQENPHPELSVSDSSGLKKLAVQIFHSFQDLFTKFFLIHMCR